MKRNPPNKNSDEQEREKNLRELEEIEKKLKKWTFDANERSGSISDALKIEADIRHLTEEDSSSVILVEVEKLWATIKHRHNSMEVKVCLLENQIQMLNNEIKNKIMFNMDTEDIKFSVYNQLLVKAKLEIFAEAADTYKALGESLEGIRKLRNFAETDQGYIQVRTLLQSEFYNCRTKAQLCYEDCYKRLVSLARQTSIDPEEIKASYIRHKMTLPTRT